MNTLDIRVAFSAADNLTRPATSARESAEALAASLRNTQNNLRDLERQSRSFSSARKHLTEVTDKIKRAQRELNGLQRLQQSGRPLTEAQQELINKLTARLERLNEVRTQERNRLREAGQALRRHGVTLSGGDRAIEAAIRRTQQYNEELERQRLALARVSRARDEYTRAMAVSEKLRGAGTAMMLAGLGGMYAGSRMVAPVMNEERYGAVIAAQTGEGRAEASGYTRLVRELHHAGIAGDAARAAEAVGAVRSTLGALGVTGDTEISRITRRMMDMQTVMGVDVPQGIQAAAIMMKNGLARSSDEALDLMVSAMQRMGPEMRGELPEIIHEYSTHFRNLGFSGAEAMSLLADMAGQGKFALDKTGDAVKEFSIRGSDMSKSSVEAYESIGLNAAQMSSAIASGGVAARDAMQKTAAGLLRIRDPAERANAAIALFGTPVEDLAVDQIPAFLGALARTSVVLGNTEGAAERMGNTLRDNLSGDVLKLTGSLAGLRADAVSTVTETLRGLVQTATQWTARMREWVQKNPELVRGLLMVAGVVAGLSAAIGGLLVTVGMVLIPLVKLRLGLSLIRALPAGISVVSGLFGGLGGVISSLGTAVGMLTGPVGLVVAALLGAGLLIYKYWDQVKAFVLGFIDGAREALAPLLATVSRFAPLLDLVAGAVSRVFLWFKSLLSPVAATRDTLDKCTVAGARFGSSLVSALTLVFSPMKALIDGLAWVLEKLGVLPGEAARVKQKLDSAVKTPVVWEWDPEQKKMVQKAWNWSPKGAGGTQSVGALRLPEMPAVLQPSANSGNGGVLDRLKGIEGNTRDIVRETKKRTGPGDIIFRNLPPALVVRGQWTEPRLAGSTGVSGARIEEHQNIKVASPPPLTVPSSGSERGLSSVGFSGEIHVHLHNVVTQDPRTLARMIGEAVKAELSGQSRNGLRSFRDVD
ncbi:TPA: phage tail tape measure protein [Escherichia coli]|nr:phage tail tape measure protein [Escherichia coli]